MKSSPVPNLRKIAKAARVSHTTVSMALHNHPRISARTKQRIAELAQKMGYRPNALVSALMSHVRSNRHIVSQEPIAFLTSGPTADWWRDVPIFLNNFHGATARAEQLGFRLQPFWMGPYGRHAAAVAKVLRARAIRGAVLAPLPGLDDGDIPFDWEHFAITTIGYSFRQVPVHRAAHHHMHSMLALYKTLRELRYRRIGLAMTLDNMVRVKYNWLAGLLTGRELYGGNRVPYLTFDLITGKKNFLAWYRANRPDVIVGIGKDTYFWLKEAGIRIPQDVGYAHLDLYGALSDENVSGIQQQSTEIGAAATDLLVSQLYHNEYGAPKNPSCMLIEGYWEPGVTAPGDPNAVAKRSKSAQKE